MLGEQSDIDNGRNETTDLSVTRQCKLFKIGRCLIYYTPVGFGQGTIV